MARFEPVSGGVSRLAAAAAASLWGGRLALEQAITRLQFVQYDPIRRPARAQDLILHQRVANYRLGDLEVAYGRLGLEEGALHVYGAMTSDLAAMVHCLRASVDEYTPTGLAAQVLQVVAEHGTVHPNLVRDALGARTVRNDWGGASSATTRALDELHQHRLLRIAGREQGVKLYELAVPPKAVADREECLKRAVLQVARLLAPVPLGSLRAALRPIVRDLAPRATAMIAELIESGRLLGGSADGVEYVWPYSFALDAQWPADKAVILAPFDPIVWDRKRFEHLWGWRYVFEAYTPAVRRRFGYYALPLFFDGKAVGWTECERDSQKLSARVGFIDGYPSGRRFRTAITHELENLATMVGASVSAIRLPR
ncbi:DNA glycosylase AlkZ-like family protein [Nocardia terpenica]|uniref:Winged helix-turn-helix domain-containing protein n=1 Tax=Nocardia terpenica TaxID=455432 RepID=A0A164KR22_9NOCA|nr:crosslink repair DNA glycosylase YcaQ family protein [Nocardia terpenica]KZM71645.1 hypothetical protein AWN90_02660 [Nocardia terpenica]NQE90868.1 winged helix-turn-helix domain-containing protein [Nocardia terpenica]